MPIASRGEMANDVAVPEYGLVVEPQPCGVGELELEETPRQAGVALAQHRLAADEVAEPAAALGFSRQSPAPPRAHDPRRRYRARNADTPSPGATHPAPTIPQAEVPAAGPPATGRPADVGRTRSARTVRNQARQHS